MGRIALGNPTTLLFLFVFVTPAENHSIRHSVVKNLKLSGAATCKDARGERGLCVFKWDCISKDGVLLSTCMDGFLFGTCCKFPNTTSTSIAPMERETYYRHPTRRISPTYRILPGAHRTTPLPWLITWSGTSPSNSNRWHYTSQGYSPSNVRDSTPYRWHYSVTNRFPSTTFTTRDRYSFNSYNDRQNTPSQPTVVSSNYMVIFDSHASKPATEKLTPPTTLVEPNSTFVTSKESGRPTDGHGDSTGTGFFKLKDVYGGTPVTTENISDINATNSPIVSTYTLDTTSRSEVDEKVLSFSTTTETYTGSTAGTESHVANNDTPSLDMLQTSEASDLITFTHWSALETTRNPAQRRNSTVLETIDSEATALQDSEDTKAATEEATEEWSTTLHAFPSVESAAQPTADSYVSPNVSSVYYNEIEPTQSTATIKTVLSPPTTVVPVSTTADSPKLWDYKKQCGVRPLKPHGRIVGGLDTYFGKWPWQVLVKEATWLGIFIKNKCGGVLINAKYVITAAHCQPGFLASLIVVLGEHDLTGDYETLKPVTKNVKKMIVHRNYNAQTFENDLALLQLDSPVEFQPHIVAICLPEKGEDFVGRTAQVSGWGKLSHGGPIPTVLQEVRVPIVANSKCQKMFLAAGHVKAIRDTFICAGYEKGGQDSCEGDSGGPLMVRRDNGLWVLVGTVSHGIRCADPNLPGVYMRMTAYKTWIQTIIKNG